LKLKYIIRVYIPTDYYFISKNVGYAREYPGTMLGPPMARCASINRIYGLYDNECKRRYSIHLWRLFSDCPTRNVNLGLKAPPPLILVLRTGTESGLLFSPSCYYQLGLSRPSDLASGLARLVSVGISNRY
jgi:hypothetical protein